MASSFHDRLPKIDLLKFSGDGSRWILFRDNFLSMIHCNEDIPIINKLQYLMQSLEGEARKPFESVDTQVDNYASTWDALKKRYDNQRFLRNKLFRGLYNLLPIQHESAQDLNLLVDDFQRHVKTLGKLGEPIEHWVTPLIFILSNMLGSATIRAWEQDTRQKDEVKYDELFEFLIHQVRMLKSVDSNLQHRSSVPTVSKVAGQIPKKPVPIRPVVNTATSETQSNTLPCHCCLKTHPLYQCPSFSNLSSSQRRELVTQHSLCWNCFHANHRARSCKSKFLSRICQAKQLTMLHDHQIAHPQQLSTETPLSVHANLGPISLLVVDRYGRNIPARALLDSAAMSNFITKKLGNKLATRQSPVDIAVAGIGESVKRIKHKLATKIVSRNSDFSTTLDILVMKKPTSHLPTSLIDTTAWKMPKVPLAEPPFNVPATIDMIIGGECYHELHTGVRHSLGDYFPFLVDTLFGWTVSGKVDSNSTTAPRACFLSTVDQTRETIPGEFQPMETADGSLRMEAEPSTIQIHDQGYAAHHSRSKDPQTTLGDDEANATHRNSTRDTHHKIPGSNGRFGMAHRSDLVEDYKPHCYLPNHPVLNEASKTTNERVVFNASCGLNSGYALKDTLLVGSVVLQNSLSATYLRATKTNDEGEDAACESCCYVVPLASVTVME
ncbi:uncharacterized protein LOC129752145 [Uranotaenia lowii]|uniref:uncharacterized protein LOC129752145 n=1 Tax=Uranotaenia lowii TaxID=190385 RepID=UPI00247AADB6|nr:uncharacterized protein LOC129752145 [Uranotaenia lowii]